MIPMFSRNGLRGWTACFILVACLGLTGCGPSTGKLTGKVTLDDAPLSGGKVHVCRVDETGNVLNTSSADIAADGSYTTPDLPVGSVKVLLQGPPLVFPMTKPPPGWKPPVDPVPVRYRQIETTDLSVVVSGGVQEYPISVRK